MAKTKPAKKKTRQTASEGMSVMAKEKKKRLLKSFRPVAFAESGTDRFGYPAWVEQNKVVTRWKMRFADRLVILLTGRVWLMVSGNHMVPVGLQAVSPFHKNIVVETIKPAAPETKRKASAATGIKH